MPRIKYHLIPNAETAPIENHCMQWILRVAAIFLMLVTIVFYNWTPKTNQLDYVKQSTGDDLQEIATGATVLVEDLSPPNDPKGTITAVRETINLFNEQSTQSDRPNTTTSTRTTQTNEPTTQSEEPKTTSSVTHFSSTEAVTLSNGSVIISSSTEPTTSKSKLLSNYFVDSSQCRIPFTDPFAKNVLKIYHKKHYSKCDTSSDMLTVTYDDSERKYKLHKHENNSSCCYKQVLRSGVNTKADKLYKLLPCTNFHQDFVVPSEVQAIITECRRLNETKVLQTDAFSFVHPQVNESKPAVDNSAQQRPSVLLWGIDSLSRMNFQRTMPQMFQYLRSQPWYELQGYNKMGDNTFPNLMAVLTGFNSTRAFSVCRPKAVGGMDACPMLWKDYKKQGYKTAYAEDWTSFATFNYNKRGFRLPPTDLYPRPLILALEKEVKKVNAAGGMPYCLGRRHSAEYIYDSAVQFTKVYRNEPSFGMFWTNTFSHNDFSMPSAMDAKMVEYMRTLDRNGIMDNTIIMFFSDHGMRFGPLRKLASGYLEERLPMIYIRLPKWFREKYSRFAQNLEANRNRLTSPYDIHATLQHILQLDTSSEQLPRPEGCASCHSVFEEVSENRNCQQAGIDEHWCACEDYNEISVQDDTAQKIAEQLVDKINDFLVERYLTKLCQRLKLEQIVSVYRKRDMKTYRVQFQAAPHQALLEASANWHGSNQTISVNVSDISRLDLYKDYSQCIKDATAQKYCICFK